MQESVKVNKKPTPTSLHQQRRKKYELIVANRQKLRQVFRMYGQKLKNQSQNEQWLMTVVDFINFANSFKLIPISPQNSGRKITSSDKAPRKHSSLVMDDAANNNNSNNFKGINLSSKFQNAAAFLNSSDITRSGEGISPRKNMSFQIANEDIPQFLRQESPAISHLSIRDGNFNNLFDMSARSSNPLSPPDAFNSEMYLQRVVPQQQQQLQQKSGNKSKNKAKLSKIIGNLEYNNAKRVNKVYQVPDATNKNTGSTLTPTQRAIHAKILRNPGGGSHSAIVGRIQNQNNFSGGNTRNKKKSTPQKQYQQQFNAFQDRQNGLSSERKCKIFNQTLNLLNVIESLPPIMTPSNIDISQIAQQQRSSSLGRSINHNQQPFLYYQGGGAYSTTQNQLNNTNPTISTKQNLSFSSKTTGPLRNANLNQYIVESRLRNARRNNNNSNLSGSFNKHIGNATTIISNPYQASINSATTLKTNDRMITSQRFQQKFQKRIEEKKSKNEGHNKKRKIQFLQHNFNNNNSLSFDRDFQKRDISAGNNIINNNNNNINNRGRTLNGMMVMLSQQIQNQTPDPLNLGTIETNRSFRIQRMNYNNISPRDSSSVESDLSIKSITLGGRLQNSINRRMGKNNKKIQKLVIDPRPPQKARDQSVESSRSYQASRSFRAESIHSERGVTGLNDDDGYRKNKQKKNNEILTLEQNVLIDGDSSLQSSSVAKIEQIQQLNKRANRAEKIAGKYKSQLDRARQVLKLFKQKFQKMNEQSERKKINRQKQIQKLENNNSQEQRPSSASNIYNNITIYANNSVNNSISINSSGSEENNKEPTTIEQLKKALNAKDQLLQKATKALYSAKKKQQVLLKQIFQLNKEKAQSKQEEKV